MYPSSDCQAEGEPPSSPVSQATDGALVDRVMAIAHLPQTAHVAVIGHHTLPFVVALLRRGPEGVRSLRPGSPAPDCGTAGGPRLDRRPAGRARARRGPAGGALGRRQARPGGPGRRGLRLAQRIGGLLGSRARAPGLDIVSFDHVARRLVLAPARRRSGGLDAHPARESRCPRHLRDPLPRHLLGGGAGHALPGVRIPPRRPPCADAADRSRLVRRPAMKTSSSVVAAPAPPCQRPIASDAWTCPPSRRSAIA